MNVAGKQKDLSKNADKLTNIFRQILAAPQILALPGMGKLFNEIIESSGFSPVDFSSLTMPAPTDPNAALKSPIQQNAGAAAAGAGAVPAGQGAAGAGA